jgi:glycerate kinase
MILVAPTSFKGTIGAAEAAAAMAAGARAAAVTAHVRELPLSDGGPGLLDALSVAGGTVTAVVVSGPLGLPVEARLLRTDGAVVVESADACGLHLVPAAARDPLRTTTRGVGELLQAAARSDGVREIICGLGGSATVDGGAGMAAALGFELLDEQGVPIPTGGGGLARLARIRPPRLTPLPPVVGLVDVKSPLLGSEGAAAVFGPQKGADAEGVRVLDAGLERLAVCVQRDLGVEVRDLRGGGAAGGLGAGLVAFAGARLLPGSDWVLETVGFERALARARLVVTGEGSYDEQSALGKLTGEVIRRARAAGIPVLLLCGTIDVALPEGVYGLDGAGRMLSADALRALTADACRRLLPA